MVRRAKGNNLSGRLAAIEAVEEAARNLEAASNKYEKAGQALMQASREKSEADKVLREALAELRKVKSSRKAK